MANDKQEKAETVYEVAVKLLVMAESPYWCKTAPREDIATELRRLSAVLRSTR